MNEEAATLIIVESGIDCETKGKSEGKMRITQQYNKNTDFLHSLPGR